MDAHPKTPMVSIVDVREVQKEFSSLTIGKELTVEVLEQLDGKDGQPMHYLAESTATNIILSCRTDDEPLTDRTVRVEVIQRKSSIPYSIVTYPFGKKPQSLDIPDWMGGDLPAPPQARKAIVNYLKWRSERCSLSEWLDIELSKVDDNEILNRILCCAYDTEELNPGYLKLKVNVARRWMRLNMPRTEINLPYALMAILLLHNSSRIPEQELSTQLELRDLRIVRSFVADWRGEASKMVQNLGRRALRSTHVEVLAQQWLLNTDNRSRDYDLWQRLQKTIRLLKLPEGVESLNSIRQFCYAVELRNKEDLKVIADGLLSTLGELPHLSNFYGEAPITLALIRIYRTMPRSKHQLWLQESHIKELTNLLSLITYNALDITLLDPLPVLS
jgi:hypothetical protein